MRDYFEFLKLFMYTFENVPFFFVFNFIIPWRICKKVWVQVGFKRSGLVLNPKRKKDCSDLILNLLKKIEIG